MSELLQIDDPEPCPTGEREYIIFNEQISEAYETLDTDERYDLENFTSGVMARRAMSLGLVDGDDGDRGYNGQARAILAKRASWFGPGGGVAKSWWLDELSEGMAAELRQAGLIDDETASRRLVVEIEPAPEPQKDVLTMSVLSLKIALSAKASRSL